MAKKSRVRHAWIAETLSKHAEELINRESTSAALPAPHTPAPAVRQPHPPVGVYEPSGLSSTERQQQDSALEYETMVLLSTLEQLLARLDDPMVQSSTMLILELLVSLTNHVVEFTEQLSAQQAHKFSLEALLRRDAASYHQLTLQHVHDNRLDLDTLVQAYGRPGSREYPQAFPLICADLLRVLNIFLMAHVKAFYSPVMRKQWKIVYTGFFVHLATTLRKIQAQVSQRG